jgi:pyridoxal phosphate enzyme (YggS family)
VTLIAVSKVQPDARVEAVLEQGHRCFGENRVQEAAEKRTSYTGQVRWELIGHLQSNKAQDAVAIFDRIQSVDSLKLLRRLDRFAGEQGKSLAILLQCNTGQDPKKFGFSVEEADSVLETALKLEHLKVEGFMTVAPLDEDSDLARVAFDRLRTLRDALAERFGVSLPELSMGMTDDLEAAIAAGSTQIRVGTALYGERSY